MKKRIFSLLLALMMALSVLPAAALADEPDPAAPEQTVQTGTDLPEESPTDGTPEDGVPLDGDVLNPADEGEPPIGPEDDETLDIPLQMENDGIDPHTNGVPIASGTDTSNTDITWTLSEEGVLTITGSGEISNYTTSTTASAPWRTAEYSALITSIKIGDGITRIGNYAFYKLTNVTSLELPNTLEAIGSSAFSLCSGLTQFDIPDSVSTLGASAFNGTGVTQVIFPKNVTAIGSAFAGCANIKEVTIPSSVTSITFGNCTGLEKVTFEDGCQITSGNSMFNGCTALKEVELPASFTGADLYMFKGCSALERVTFLGECTSIGIGAFQSCVKLTSFTIPDTVTSIGDSAFNGCTGLTSIVIPDSVTALGTGVFSGCTGLTSITVPTGLESIPNNLVYGCTGLTSIDIPDTVTSIGNYTFYNCTSLTSIVIPDKVTTLGNGVFTNCTSLTSIVIPDSVTALGTGVFSGCTGLETLVFPASVTSIDANIFQDCGKLGAIYYRGTQEQWAQITGIEGNAGLVGTTIVCDYNGTDPTPSIDKALQEAVTGTCGPEESESDVSWTLSVDGKLTISGTGPMGDYTYNLIFGTFYSNAPWKLYTNFIQMVEIGEGVTSVGKYAFCGCSQLTSVTLAETVESIERGSFESCSSLEEISIPKNVTALGDYAFEGCTNLLSVIFDPECRISDTNTHQSMFSKCITLEEIDLPQGMTEIGTMMFYSCSALKRVTLPDGVTKIGDDAFQSCANLESITLPDTVTEWGESTHGPGFVFQHCTKLTYVDMGKGITEIPTASFGWCDNLTTIVLPAGLTKVNTAAFNLCAKLTTVYFGGSKEQWEAIDFTSTNDYLKNAPNIIYDYKGAGAPPIITAQPTKDGEEVSWSWSQEPTPLKVSACAAEDGAVLSYQWYMNTEDNVTGGIPVALTPDGPDSECAIACEFGTYYYYCAVSSIKDGTVGITKSDTVKVTVTKDGTAFTGDGTETSPYQLAEAEDLQKLSRYTAYGENFPNVYFQMTADIELPVDWIPIGALKPTMTEADLGRNIRAFSGIFDGGGHKLTVPVDGQPLFGYVHNAAVSNLKIYGERIAGDGLIAHYDVNYGQNGEYGSGAGLETVSIDGVTLLSGTKTLRSGFLGGSASGMNIVNITNCTIEKGVVIGYDGQQSQIGSFAGGFNGYLTNCVSYADVYGVDCVGGLVGVKAQSMGPFEVQNSQFHGTVTATGDYAGGIIGSGYDGKGTAPNTPCASIRNCIVSGSITGNDKVGGLLGGEPGSVQNWENGFAKISDNLFVGTVTAGNGAAYVGAAVGYMNSLNVHNKIENNYYKDGCGTANGIGGVWVLDTSVPDPAVTSGTVVINTQGKTSAELQQISSSLGVYSGAVARPDHNRTDDPLGADADKLAKAVTAAELKDGTVVQLLNGSADGYHNWVQGADYPTHSGAAVVTGLTVGGDYKSTYYVGDALDLTGIVFTVHWSDGNTTTPALEEVTVTGYDSSKRGAQTLKAVYQGVETEFTVTVLLKPSSSGSNEITVTFTLLGDVKHDNGEPNDNGGPHTLKGNNLVEWIPKTSYTVDLNATVKDVFELALRQNSITWENPSGNYVESITRGGVTLAEFTNGNHSGWMYTLNQVHSSLGVSEQYLNDGNDIVFHYTDDYTVEKGSENWSSGGSGGSSGSSGNGSTVSKPVINVEVSANSKGEATVQVTESALNKAIADAKSSNADTITVISDVTGNAVTVSVALPKETADEIVRQTSAQLCIETFVGQMDIPNNTLSALLREAKGSDLTLTITKKTAEQAQELLDRLAETASPAQIAGSVVTEVTLTSGKNAITTWGGKALTLYIPVDNAKFEAGKSYTVYQFSEDGTSEVLTGMCVEQNKQLFVQITVTHLSTFVVLQEAVNEAEQPVILPFTDVNEGDWFYDAVGYAYANALFRGTSETAFEPNATMTRAMFITVLYRMEGEPNVTGTNLFSDIPSGEWYTDAVIWANGSGIVNGVTETICAPNVSITREQAAAMLLRYAAYKGYDTTATADLDRYADKEQISDWAYRAMQWANGRGLVIGRTATALEPMGTATRAEVAALLMRFLEGRNESSDAR